ncbi:MAG: mechanosensitive ion channel family protein [Bacteroidales bacterium]|nr:mechanosensitive ion channel family protein [Bacteroidales bacterium]
MILQVETMIPDSAEVVEQLKTGVAQTTEQVNTFWASVREFYVNTIMANVPKIILMIVLLWLGWYLVNRLTEFIKKMMIKRDTDVSLRNFLGSLINILLKVVLVMTIMSMVGVQIASFVALLGSVGLAIGMALQGTLQNFAGGVIILLLKPFKVGDFIEQGSFSGTVNMIQIFNTYLTTPDNKVIIIPNSQLATSSLINYTRSDHRRLDIPVGISYGESVEKVRSELLALAAACPLVLSEPEAPSVNVADLGNGYLNLTLRFWVKTNDYWTALFEMNQSVYDKMVSAGYMLPAQKIDVHVSNK